MLFEEFRFFAIFAIYFTTLNLVVSEVPRYNNLEKVFVHFGESVSGSFLKNINDHFKNWDNFKIIIFLNVRSNVPNYFWFLSPIQVHILADYLKSGSWVGYAVIVGDGFMQRCILFWRHNPHFCHQYHDVVNIAGHSLETRWSVSWSAQSDFHENTWMVLVISF